MNEGQLSNALRAVDEAISRPIITNTPRPVDVPGSRERPLAPTAKLIDERHKTHGEYNDTARIAQALKSTMRECSSYSNLSPDKQESLDMIASKIARILSGNAETPDHFDDIAGYAMLAKVRIK